MSFITDGASVLPPVKTDARGPTGASTEWASQDTNKVRQALLDVRTAVIADEADIAANEAAIISEAQTRAAADAAIVASGAAPANVGLGLVTSTGSTTARVVADRFADFVNVKDFGAVGDGMANDTSAIAAALVAGVGNTVYFPAGTYITNSPMRVRNATVIRGAGRTSTRIVANASFSGDALIVAYNRDDNNVNVWDQFVLEDISIQVPQTPDIIGIDLTGTRSAVVARVNAYGPSLTSGTAIRMSDENPTATSIKSSFFTAVRDFNSDASQWKLFLYLEQKHGNCNNWFFENIASYSTNGVQFNYVVGGALGRIANWYMAGPGGNNAVVGTIPTYLSWDQVSVDLLTNNLPWATNYSINSDSIGTGTLSLHKATWANASGRTSAPAAFASMGTAAFDGAGYLKISSGTAIAAGSNSFFWYSNSPIGAQPSIVIVPVAGMPAVPISFAYGWSSAPGYPFFIYVLSQASFTLPNDLILWVGWIDNGGGALAANTPAVPAVVSPRGGTVSSDRGDTSQTLTVGTDAPVQRWATALSQNRTVTLSTTGAANGDVFRVVRTGLGAFTLDVGGLKTIPSATAAFVDVSYNGSAWVLTGYGTL